MNDQFPLQISAIQCTQTRRLRTSDYLLLLALSDGISVQGFPELSAGFIAFLAPFSGKKIHLQSGSRAIYAEIPTSFLEQAIGARKQQSAVLPHADGLTETLIELFELQRSQISDNALDGQIAALRLLKELSQVLDHASDFRRYKTVADAGVSAMTEYLDEHFREQVQLDDLSRVFHLSNQYISSYFHRNSGMTVSAYLQALRREEAEYLLSDTGLSLTEIAARSGFSSVRTMNQAFVVQYRCTVKEYRSQVRFQAMESDEREDQIVLQDVSMWLQPYRLVHANSAAAAHRSCSVSVSDGEPIKQVWREILNIDVPADCLHATVQDRLREVQSQLHFKYARLYNVFCMELIGYIPSTAQYRFTGLIRLIDFLKSVGLTPMLTFGQVYEIQSEGIVTDENCYLRRPADWQEALGCLLDVAISRWGKDWVSTWLFEFHMPEKLYGNPEPAEFIRLFQTAARQIHQKLPGAGVGGPAMPLHTENLPKWKAWFEGLTEGEQPDFISMELWAAYTVRNSPGLSLSGGNWESWSVAELKSANSSEMMAKIQTVQGMAEEAGMGMRPLYISAIGITKYQAAAAQIGGHCPAWLVKSSLALASAADGVGCWKFYDSEPEYPDEYQVIGSGCGIIGRYGLKNPSWYAYYLLAQLLPYKIFASGNLIVTTDHQNHYAILIHNCKEYSELFCRNYLTSRAQQFEDQRLYLDSAPLTQEIHLDGIKPQGYMVKQSLIGDHHGCAAYVLKQMGDILQFSEDEANYIAGQSLPYQHTFLVPEQSDFKITVTLRPNEVMLLQISPEQKK